MAENHHDNRLMLLYYGGGRNFRPTGCFDYDRNEWQGIIIGNLLMERFRLLPPWPDRRRVMQLQQELGITVHHAVGAPV